MNHHVPEFDMDDFYSPPSSRGNNTQDDEIMELVWHSGQLGVQNQSHRKSSPPLKSHQEERQLNQPPERNSDTHLFMQEDEMTSWLHYPLDDDPSFHRNLTDLLYHPPAPSAAPPPHQYIHHQPMPPPPAVGVNFPRLKPRFPESGQAASSRNNELREATVAVESSDTPKSCFLQESRSAMNVSGGAISRGGESISISGAAAGTSTAGGDGGYMVMNSGAEACGGSVSLGSATATADLRTPPPLDDRKRKGRESPDATENQSEDLEIEAKKQFPESGTSLGKRSRASEVHNQSERRRRDRINEKMKALQDLIPRCNKTDKASMLDEAIEYLKFLQLQVQMMSMGYYGVLPMLFPGVQQYMPFSPMGVGMGMETVSNQPMLPFPTMGGSPSAFGPRFTFPSFPPPPVPAFDPSRVQSSQMESVVRFPNLADPYQQYVGAQQMPVQQMSQNRPDTTPSSSKPSTRKQVEDDENNPNG